MEPLISTKFDFMPVYGLMTVRWPLHDRYMTVRWPLDDVFSIGIIPDFLRETYRILVISDFQENIMSELEGLNGFWGNNFYVRFNKIFKIINMFNVIRMDFSLFNWYKETVFLRVCQIENFIQGTYHFFSENGFRNKIIKSGGNEFFPVTG